MALRLILVRHGETVWNREGRYQGQSDIPLNLEGIRQARLLSARFRGQRIDAVYSSDLQRARATAAIITDSLGLKVSLEPDLREMDFGEWEGLTFKEIEEAYGGILRDWLEDPLGIAPPGGEKLEEVTDRVLGVVDRLKERHLKATCSPFVGLVVTHGGPIRVIVSHILGLDFRGSRGFSLDHGGFSIVDFFEEGAVIRSLNDTCHLSAGS